MKFLCLFLCFVGALSSPLDESDPQPSFNPLTDIQYHLFTRKNPTEAQRLVARDINTVIESNWNRANPFRFIIHGHNSGVDANMNRIIRDGLLAAADSNVVVIDWSAGSNTLLSSTARGRVATAGVAIANFIDELHRQNLIDFSRTHFIGHNLGAHVAGNVGKNLVRGRLQAIFGLDPAGSGFTSGDIDRLSINDAVYTEAIHTNAGTNGFAEPITKVAFYPNWGSSQPGCGIAITASCSHERANLLYAESLTSDRFVGRQCSGYQQISGRNCPGIGVGVMGGDAVKNLNGVFYLATNSASPFARG